VEKKMVSGEQNLKMLKKQFAMIEELNDSFNESYTCEGVKCEDCPFNMGNKELPFRGKMTSCAYAAMSEMIRKIVYFSF
jgi:hypothetical protein